jgi:hypothetical protein
MASILSMLLPIIGGVLIGLVPLIISVLPRKYFLSGFGDAEESSDDELEERQILSLRVLGILTTIFFEYMLLSSFGVV